MVGRVGTGIVLAFSLAVALLASMPQTARAEPVAAGGGATSLVGAWIIHGNPDNPAQREVGVFTADGLAFRTSTPSSLPPPPEEAPPGFLPPGTTRLFGSQDYGVWESLGGREYAIRWVSILYDEQGGNLGALFTLDCHVTLDATGNAFTGTGTGRLSLPDGATIDVFGSVPFTATRLTIGSAP